MSIWLTELGRAPATKPLPAICRRRSTQGGCRSARTLDPSDRRTVIPDFQATGWAVLMAPIGTSEVIIDSARQHIDRFWVKTSAYAIPAIL